MKTANELADELIQIARYPNVRINATDPAIQKEAAAMLRSQAAEIFALNGEVANKADYAKSMYLMHEEAKAELEQERAKHVESKDTYHALRAALEAKQEPDYWRAEAERYAGNADYWRKRCLAAENRTATPQDVQRKPLEPVIPKDANINQRISFKAGWRAAEAAHGITAYTIEHDPAKIRAAFEADDFEGAPV